MMSSPMTSSSSFKLASESLPFSNRLQHSSHFPSTLFQLPKTKLEKNSQTSIRFRNRNSFRFSCCSSPADITVSNLSPSTPTTATETAAIATTTTTTAAVLKKRKRYRKQYPGESKGIVEEMRFIAMKLRNNSSDNKKGEEMKQDEEEPAADGDSDADTWQPSMEGFLKYLVDSKLVFETLDHIVDESNHVAYAYFRKTGLERSESLSKDLEWFRQQDIVIPQPSPPGISYAEYLNEIAEKSAPVFLCHFYNIYFSHIAGGQVIVKQVCDGLLEGREMEFCKWEGDVQELLKDMREKLNKLGEYWSRDEKNKCLREAAKSFRFSGQIIRLIIL
ncbi:probable inactive heme oxygenase 2, chloroplastic isoform X2 [Magnolia sinica]|uniref:probable inactive heme oxygenase 2, chloroplastic isoform X2 n=1 Tax=Magnolia sinica TaxID=86752 RepID=UPI002658136F|nr:probable inactive heme oxygenase 2, chloroplastic isoform X2 [Magnolia sinica]